MSHNAIHRPVRMHKNKLHNTSDTPRTHQKGFTVMRKKTFLKRKKGTDGSIKQ